jgi:hypothetical protein
VSLLVLLDLRSIPISFVVVFLVLSCLLYTHKIKIVSIAFLFKVPWVIKQLSYATSAMFLMSNSLPIITSPEIKADSFEVSPGLLNLIAKD